MFENKDPFENEVVVIGKYVSRSDNYITKEGYFAKKGNKLVISPEELSCYAPQVIEGGRSEKAGDDWRFFDSKQDDDIRDISLIYDEFLDSLRVYNCKKLKRIIGELPGYSLVDNSFIGTDAVCLLEKYGERSIQKEDFCFSCLPLTDEETEKFKDSVEKYINHYYDAKFCGYNSEEDSRLKRFLSSIKELIGNI
ncbi:hypothetical protein SAMN04488587_2274 [Methanococcoides vulcani]|uniref:Uncharacterized protein n=1 Tax=Methanococcoides vulcani TaxID=1353158 RepID=A0A1I0BPS1_9EURY|nr:hypothetical protein [Methanococcoides vulcani]SET08879.1 hypothetical protein SAMN04488587_2274 [Methanococcoides vulcani]